MPIILNIETSTTCCSVALSRNSICLGHLEIDNGYSHSENLADFIAKCLDSTGLKSSDINAVAITSGPGSYTGLRIGSALAKGMCSALKIPLLTMSTLKVMALHPKVREQSNSFNLCPSMDARRNEIYYGICDSNLTWLVEPNALVLDEQPKLLDTEKRLLVFGSGGEKIILNYPEKDYHYIKDIKPLAQNMVTCSHQLFKEKKFTNLHFFKPDYLKPFFSTMKRSIK